MFGISAPSAMGDGPPNSRIAGFYKRPLERRLSDMLDMDRWSDASRTYFEQGGGLDPATADRMSENVIAACGLPYSVGLNFTINGRDVLVPMAVEEPSVVAAASNAARMVRQCGGFTGAATEPIMTAQVQLDEVLHADEAPARIEAERDAILAAGNAAIPRMVARGGGCRDIETRVIDSAEGLVVLHVHVHVGDAMGANMVDTVAEAVSTLVHKILGGRLGLRILTNLGVRRMVTVEAALDADACGGEEILAAIARASRFAERDPYRAVTHNKGIMNGVDAVAVALGQDWRAIEAGAHGFAALSGQYTPLATWRTVDSRLQGKLHMPLAVATVGGSTNVHPGVRGGFELCGVTTSGELAVLIGSVGLASNLAALRALVGEGIQKGHMRLHQRKNDADREG